jgi:hypothetical protein
VNRDLHLTEYRLVNMWSNFSVANYSLTADVRTAFGLQSRLYGKFGEYTASRASAPLPRRAEREPAAERAASRPTFVWEPMSARKPDTRPCDVAGGNYSALTVRFDLAREVGHYIMDYFVPSILLVVVSWVSFWLDPNAVPGRTTLGKVQSRPLPTRPATCLAQQNAPLKLAL